jgi:hypothetical protein
VAIRTSARGIDGILGYKNWHATFSFVKRIGARLNLVLRNPTMTQIADCARVLWHWMAANGLLVLAVVNFTVFICTIGLAIQAVFVARRLTSVAQMCKVHSSLITSLMKESDARTQAGESVSPAPVIKFRRNNDAAILSVEKTESLPGEPLTVAGPCRDMMQPTISSGQYHESAARAQVVRKEIDSLRAEMMAEDHADKNAPAAS